ncbi:MAG: EAL domain-containing protein [Variibacter sp.]
MLPKKNERPAAAGEQPDPAEILSAIGEVAYDWRLDDDVLTWGPNAGDVLAVDDLGAIGTGRGFARLFDPENLVTPYDVVMQSSHQDDGRGVAYQIEYALLREDGERVWLEDTGRWFAGANGRPALARGVVRVVSERHENDQRLAYLSRFDDLTGEMNRWRLTEILGAALDDSIKGRSSCAFLLIAVDNLTRINEAYGFGIADEVISAVARRLRSKLRTSDALGRFSGNKFGVVLRNCTPDEMAVAADRLLAGIRDEVMQTSAGVVAVTITIGGIVAPRHAREVPEVLARAQETLTLAKAKRPGSFLAYRPSVEREAIRRENIRATDEIVAALNDRRILLAFEPVVDTISREPVFYESLMRVRFGDGSLTSALGIVPVAERLGLVRLLDNRVLELVIDALMAAPSTILSVNVSPASTLDPDWWTTLGAQLRAYPEIAERLIVEITEMAAIHDVEDTRAFISRVKDLGCHIAIDDFGAGHTSFRNLRRMGVDIVKIDGAFVENLTRSADDAMFVRTMIDLAHGLDLRTVAEWVQDEESAAMLRQWGCDYLQGSLIGKASTEQPWLKASRQAAGQSR